VQSVSRLCGCTALAAKTVPRRVSRQAISAASANADAPSYIDALATSIPVSMQIID